MRPPSSDHAIVAPERGGRYPRHPPGRRADVPETGNRTWGVARPGPEGTRVPGTVAGDRNTVLCRRGGIGGRLRLGLTVLAALTAGVVGLLGGRGAQAAGTCGSEVLAHRGGHSAQVDENTLESIERAYQLGAWTENDVFLTKDGQFVIIHNQG